MATSLPPAYAAPTSQVADARVILDASAHAMDAAQSMRFSGAMDMSLFAPDTTAAVRIFGGSAVGLSVTARALSVATSRAE